MWTHLKRSGALASSLALIAGAGVLGPQAASADAPPPTVTATGTGEVKPTPANRRSESSIRQAVELARQQALPLAFADARRRAVEFGYAANLYVGGLLSVDDPAPSPFFYDASRGTFGQGRFCGTVSRYRFVRNAQGRIVSRKRIGSRRVCRVPSRVTASVSVTYAASPKG